jgi:hypothetical protein
MQAGQASYPCCASQGENVPVMNTQKLSREKIEDGYLVGVMVLSTFLSLSSFWITLALASSYGGVSLQLFIILVHRKRGFYMGNWGRGRFR